MKLQRREFLKACSAGMAALLIDRLGATSRAVDHSALTKPNIVFILADDLGYGDVHCLNPEHGKIATPNLDKLAAQGMTFTDAHSTSAVCTPSRYSILTGRYNWRSPLQSGVLSGMSKPLIPAERLTVARLLQQSGYTTAGIGKWHLGMTMPEPLTQGLIRDNPTERGFNYFFGISASLDMPPYAFIENDHFTEAPTATKELYRGRRGPAVPGFEAVDVLPTLAKKSVGWILQQGKGPFFLYLALNAPHTPLNPTPRWRGKSGLGSYADYVMETDWAVGEVLQALEQVGVASNTLVIFTSDNGCAPYIGTSPDVDPMAHKNGDVEQLEAQGHFPSANRRGHKSDAWDGGHRIPFLVRWPARVKAGTQCGQLTGQVDFLATCAEIVGARLPDNAGEDSISLLPLFKGEDKPVRDTLVHHSIQGNFAIREGKWKLLLCPGSGGWGQPTNPQARQEQLPAVQLYDMSVDEGERRNVEVEHPDVVARLTTRLEQMVADGRSTPGAKQENDVPVALLKNGK